MKATVRCSVPADPLEGDDPCGHELEVEADEAELGDAIAEAYGEHYAAAHDLTEDPPEDAEELEAYEARRNAYRSLSPAYEVEQT